MGSRILAVLPLWLCLAFPAGADFGGELHAITEHLMLDGNGQLPTGGTVYQPEVIETFYAENGYQPVWNNRPQAEEALALLAASELEGLNPADYHYPELANLVAIYDRRGGAPDPVRARFDVLLTDGLVLYLRHLIEGKVDPRLLDPSFNYPRRQFTSNEIVRAVNDGLARGRITQEVEALIPSERFYRQMRAALAHYRQLAASETFRPIPEDTVLKPGESHPNVIPLRKRLAETGYLDPDATSSTAYDNDVRDAVIRFQRDHALDDDGIVGRQSFDLLNLSYAERVDKLRINMDRLRWLHQSLSDEFIVVNIAGFELYYIRNGEVVWDTPVMTGTVAHQTPIFTTRLAYLEFNPTWTVPRSIINRSLFPKFKANPQYVLDNQYRLYDRDGVSTDPFSIDWDAYNGRNFPYRVVQQPGDKNALGRVKFIFPNRYAVYLHDTPSRQLFARSARAFSSGCIRVKDPLEFAEVLLDDPRNWSLAQVEATVASRKPQQVVRINRPIDVMLMYWTTSPTRGGRVQFHPDVYSKDAATLAALNAPPSVLGMAGG